MSKGSPIISVRIKPLLLASVRESVERLCRSDRSPVNGLNDWILEAIIEKLRHEARGKKATAKRKTSKDKGQTSEANTPQAAPCPGMVSPESLQVGNDTLTSSPNSL